MASMAHVEPEALQLLDIFPKAIDFIVGALKVNHAKLMKHLENARHVANIQPHILEHIKDLARLYRHIHKENIEYVESVSRLAKEFLDYLPHFPKMIRNKKFEDFGVFMQALSKSFACAHAHFKIYMGDLKALCSQLDDIKEEVKGDLKGDKEALEDYKKESAEAIDKRENKDLAIHCGKCLAIGGAMVGALLAAPAALPLAGVVGIMGAGTGGLYKLTKEVDKHCDPNGTYQQLLDERKHAIELTEAEINYVTNFIIKLNTIHRKLEDEERSVKKVNTKMCAANEKGNAILKYVEKCNASEETYFHVLLQNTIDNSIEEFKTLKSECDHYLTEYGHGNKRWETVLGISNSRENDDY
eukprot:g8436.t1